MKYLLAIICMFLVFSEVVSEELRTHYIDYPLEHIHDPELLKVVEINQPMPVLESFPLDVLRTNGQVVDFNWHDKETLHITLMIDGKIREAVRCRYYIQTTREDTELRMASLLIHRSGGTANSLDIGRYGEIGDNSWFFPDSTIVEFTRNNVVVQVTALTPEFNPDAVYTCAQILDEIIKTHLISHDKAHIPAPVIKEVEYEPYSSDKRYMMIHVNAYDPKGQDLTYTYLGLPDAISYDKGEFKFSLLTYDPPICHIWVMNEDRIFSSVRLSF